MTRRTYWEDRFEERPVRTLVQLGLGILAGCLLLGAVAWGVTVVVSGIKGDGDSVKTKNSSDNFINAQAGFVRDNAEFQTGIQKIRDQAKQLADFEHAHPNLGNGTPYDPMAEQDQNLRTTLTGLVQTCQNTAADYNTRSQSYLSQDFKDNGLPDRLDPAQCSTAGG